MRNCDVFVFLDDAQMPGGQSYVYRTQIRGRQSTQWLSVPTRFHLGMAIRDAQFADPGWARKHLGTLRAVYARCPYFKEVFSFLEPIYAEPGERLAPFNERLIRAVAAYLEFPCRFEVSSELRPEGEGDDRLISLARLLGADEYLSGKGGQNYQDPAKFAAAGIKLTVGAYTAIPYQQVHGEFVPNLSILDALFHLGRDTLGVLAYPTS
jgi:hypothetical protein